MRRQQLPGLHWPRMIKNNLDAVDTSRFQYGVAWNGISGALIHFGQNTRQVRAERYTRKIITCLLILVCVTAAAIPREDVLECQVADGSKFVLKFKYDWSP